MSLDRKIYLATALGALALTGALAAGAPLLASEVVVHVAEQAPTAAPASNAVVVARAAP